MNVAKAPVLQVSLARTHGTLVLFATTILLGAALLFALELMFAKMTLPLLGGSPAVWITSVVFYQLLFVAGYLYAHWLRECFAVGAQITIHAVLVLAAAFTLPIAADASLAAHIAQAPLRSLATFLARGVGLPFFVLASTSPLMQAWFSNTKDDRARNPYFLYAASNAGSLASVLLYPFAIEPLLGLHLQSEIWTFGYVGFAACVLGCALLYGRTGARTSRARATNAERIAAPRRLRWIVLAAVPSSLLLGVTAHLSTMVAPLPVLWALPLALYLTTFIIVFSTGLLTLRRVLRRVVPYAVLPVILMIALQSKVPIGWYVALHCTAFFLLALALHGEIAEDRPSAERLTDFYLMIAVGGALGGLFNALVAPFLFPHVGEYPLALIAACALLPALGRFRRERRLDLLLPAALAAAMFVALSLGRAISEDTLPARIVFGAAAVVCFAFSGRPLRFALGLGAVLLAATLVPNSWGRELAVERNFFGVKRILAEPDGRYLLFAHGATIHGLQSTDPQRAREPLAYFTRPGPLGQIYAVAAARHPRMTVGVVGLGIGTIACYRRPGQHFVLYEIDPAVERMARTQGAFSYLSACAPSAPVIIGDARLSLATGPRLDAGLLILDAYSADQLPLHLVTREALRIYELNLRPGGLLAFNISSNYFDLSPILGNLAHDAEMVAYVRDARAVTPAQLRAGTFGSVWVVMAHADADLGTLTRDRRWRRLGPEPRLRLWTDDYSSLMRLLVYHYTS